MRVLFTKHGLANVRINLNKFMHVYNSPILGIQIIKNSSFKEIIDYFMIFCNKNHENTNHTSHYYRINKKGKIIEEAYFFDNGWDYYEEGLARFVENGKIGFFNKKGDHVIKARYDFAISFKDGISIVSNGGNCHDHSKNLHEDKCCCMREEYVGCKWGAINSKGEVIVPIDLLNYSQIKKELNKLLYSKIG